MVAHSLIIPIFEIRVIMVEPIMKTLYYTQGMVGFALYVSTLGMPLHWQLVVLGVCREPVLPVALEKKVQNMFQAERRHRVR